MSSRSTRHDRHRELPIVYVNDNYGDWNSSARELADAALKGEHPELVEPVQMGVDRLVPAGQVTEQCILYSALDAYVPAELSSAAECALG